MLLCEWAVVRWLLCLGGHENLQVSVFIENGDKKSEHVISKISTQRKVAAANYSCKHKNSTFDFL